MGPSFVGRLIGAVSQAEVSVLVLFKPRKNWIPSIKMTPIPVDQLSPYHESDRFTQVLECESKEEWPRCLSGLVTWSPGL
jgi:hypothetical protein